MTNTISKKLTKEETITLLELLKTRFNKNMQRHKGISWDAVQAKLKKSSKKIWSISEMERTGGEPDVTGFDKKTSEFIFTDCSDETPKGRRSTCYDNEALTSRKENAPENSALDMAKAMGIEILNEDQYRKLQKLGKFDQKTSSWIETPATIRRLGGALFADYRYDNVFVYHNGAQSYYAARGFRGQVKI